MEPAQEAKVHKKKKALTEAEIEKRFPAHYISGNPTCVVCLSEIEETELARTTQCGHEFHADCVSQWWMYRPRKQVRCPVCRHKQRMKDSSKDATPTGGKEELDAIGVDVSPIEPECSIIGLPNSPSTPTPRNLQTDLPEDLQLDDQPEPVPDLEATVA